MLCFHILCLACCLVYPTYLRYTVFLAVEIYTQCIQSTQIKFSALNAINALHEICTSCHNVYNICRKEYNYYLLFHIYHSYFLSYCVILYALFVNFSWIVDTLHLLLFPL